MKKKTALLALMLLVSFTFQYVMAYDETEPVTVADETETESEIEDSQVITEDFYAEPYADDLNVRSGPGTSFEVVGELLLDEEAHVIGKDAETGWYLIEREDGNGYVCGSLMRLTRNGETDIEQETDTDLTHLIKAEGFVPQERLDAFNERLSMAPDYLLQAFVNSGWKMYLTEYDVGNTYGKGKYGRLQGITKYNEKVIYLDNRDIVIDAVLHEFGHFVDWYYDFPSSSAEFAPIYANAGTFNSYFGFTNGIYDEKEVFAEMFFDRITRPEEFETVCPEAYTFMERWF